jgi:hypothetical protein
MAIVAIAKVSSAIASFRRLSSHSLKPRFITGHIDFLQARNGAIHILDYKPDARTNKPIAQLTIYALALTRLVPGLRLFDINCAWFNETCYNEFYPRLVLPRPQKSFHQMVREIHEEESRGAESFAVAAFTLAVSPTLSISSPQAPPLMTTPLQCIGDDSYGMEIVRKQAIPKTHQHPGCG